MARVLLTCACCDRSQKDDKVLADDDETDDRVESQRRQQKVVVDDILSPVSPCSTVVSRRVAKSEWGGLYGGHLIGMWPAERPSNVTIATSRDSVPRRAGDVGLSLATIFASSSCCRLSMTLISKRKFALMREKLLRARFYAKLAGCCNTAFVRNFPSYLSPCESSPR